MEDLALYLRRLWLGPETDTGRRWHARTERERGAVAHARRREFLRALRCTRPTKRIIVGRAEGLDEPFEWCGLPLRDLLSQHWAVSGATGVGKSYVIAVILLQLIKRGVPVVVIDRKSELVDILVRLILPALIAAGQYELLDQIRVIRPFDRSRVPLLRLTEREPRVGREVQSLNLAQALSEAVGRDLGPRMLRALLPAASLAVEREMPLTRLADWFRYPETFVRAATASDDPMIRAYALNELPRENRSSLDALRANLDLLFHLPEVRAALNAPRCLDFHECFERGVTLLDFGTVPGGGEAPMRFIAGPTMGRLARAILSRELRHDSRPCVVLFEEFQESLHRHQIEQFKRLLSLARFKKFSLWFSNQQPAQIAEADRTLLRVLRTNVGGELIFRSSVEDARALSEGFLSRSPEETLTQARSRFVEEIASLPRRSFFLWLKGTSYGPQRRMSPRLDLAALRQAAASLPAETRRRIRTGVSSVDRKGLEAQVAAETAPPRQPRIVPLDDARPRAKRLG